MYNRSLHEKISCREKKITLQNTDKHNFFELSLDEFNTDKNMKFNDKKRSSRQTIFVDKCTMNDSVVFLGKYIYVKSTALKIFKYFKKIEHTTTKEINGKYREKNTKYYSKNTNSKSKLIETVETKISVKYKYVQDVYIKIFSYDGEMISKIFLNREIYNSEKRSIDDSFVYEYEKQFFEISEGILLFSRWRCSNNNKSCDTTYVLDTELKKSQKVKIYDIKCINIFREVVGLIIIEYEWIFSKDHKVQPIGILTVNCENANIYCIVVYDITDVTNFVPLREIHISLDIHFPRGHIGIGEYNISTNINDDYTKLFVYTQRKLIIYDMNTLQPIQTIYFPSEHNSIFHVGQIIINNKIFVKIILQTESYKFVHILDDNYKISKICRLSNDPDNLDTCYYTKIFTEIRDTKVNVYIPNNNKIFEFDNNDNENIYRNYYQTHNNMLCVRDRKLYMVKKYYKNEIIVSIIEECDKE